MKKKEITAKKKVNHPPKLQVQKETCEECYRQLNLSAFKQSFKLLIDHYKLQ